jgi:hypothetical protein
MSIFQKIFGTPAPAAPAAPQMSNNPQNNPAPPAPASSAATAPNGVIPAGSATPPAGQSPEDKFAKLWETPDPAPTGTDAAKQAENNLTPEKMLEAAGKVDFKRIMDPDSLRKISAGGDEAMVALAELLNKTAQTVYGQSTVVAQKLIESQVADAERRFAEQVPGLVKRQSLRESLITDNPAFAKPSVAPVVTAIQTQLAQKFPNATTAELNALAKDYLKQAAEDFNPTPKKEPTAAERGIDWDSWVENSSRDR